MDKTTGCSIVFVVAAIVTSVLEIKNADSPNFLPYLLLFLLWSIICFFVWIRAVFYGNWGWSEEELIMHEPVMGRIAIFLAYAMGIIWLAVPVITAGIILIRKKGKASLKDKVSK